MFFGCENLNFEYADQKILKDLTLNFNKGEFVGLVGDNGSGKSTLMKVLSGILLPQSGKVLFDDTVMSPKNKQYVGYIFQNPENQIVGVTVEEDVAFGLENIGIQRESMIELISWALDVVGLSKYAKADPNTLSGGQKQRLAIAAIVAMKPEIILMDEPTTMLDPIGRSEVYEVIKKLVSLKKTIIIASHHSDDLSWVNRIIGLKEGKIIFDGSRDSFYSSGKLAVEVPFDIKLKKNFNKSFEQMVDHLCQ